jgi:hypothetical protein
MASPPPPADGAPQPKKKRSFGEFLSFVNPISYLPGNSPDTDTTNATQNATPGVATTATAATAPSKTPMTEQEIREYYKNRIDQMFAEKKTKSKTAELENPSRKLTFKPNIIPADPEWIAFKAKITAALKTSSMSSIFEESFETAQRILISPPETQCTILDIQKRNSKDYLELVGESGRFRGQGDNLSTKLTLLHFGFPVAPITITNMINTDENDDTRDDADDDPLLLPNFQPIMFAEKPLEFLDKYNERAYGFQSIRRKYFSFDDRKC